jgi:hypothetical protein
MKKESASAIMSSTQETLGFTLTHEAIFIMQKFAQGFGEILAPVKTTSTMEEFMAAMPEPENLPLTMGIMKVLPAMMRQFATQSAETITRAFPPDKQGRPKALTIEDKKRIVAKIGMLHTQGVSIGDAMRRASQQFSVSRSSVRRAWADRAALPNKPAMTVEDAWRILAADFKRDAVVSTESENRVKLTV